ncbi:hypothetical protein ABSA28_00192 [Candidatus Hepatincolaceae symbiont of Richtersius coronifer]
MICYLTLDNKPIEVSFFGNLALTQINPPIIADNGISIASSEDVLTTKLRTITRRGSNKDYIDIAIGLERSFRLGKLLENTKKLYGENFNYILCLKALTYHKDLNLEDRYKSTINKHVKDFFKQQKKLQIMKDKLLLDLASRIVWFENPEITVKNQKNVFKLFNGIWLV